MSPAALRREIRKLQAKPKFTTALELAMANDGYRGKQPSQKEHLLGWLREYDGPGYYGRKDWNRSAEFVYNHINCPPMALWLSETSGVSRVRVQAAFAAALAAAPSLPRMCAAIRNVIPWKMVESRLLNRREKRRA